MHAEGFVTVIAGPDDELLGCHIVGPDASSILQEPVLSMTAGSGTVQDVRDTIHIHPALPEVVQRAFSGRFTPPGDGHAHHHE
jgi:dihydrolipoamide dehydrogenase